MTRRVLVTVPNVLRDLEGCALVGYHLEKCRGLEVRYTTGRGLLAGLFEWIPDVLVLDQMAWDYRARQATLAKRMGCRLVVMPTSGFFQDTTQHALIAGKAFEATPLIDRYLAWGELARQSLLEDTGLSPAQVRTTGSPRFDFYSPPYTAMIRDKRDFLAQLGASETNRPVVTWTPGNVAYAATDAETLTRWAEGTRMDPGVFREEMEDTVDQYNEHAPWIVEIASRRPFWTVIVKVHPGDRLSRYLWMRERAPNIHVVQNVPIRELLCHTDVLIQWCSTAANEAWMLKKPVLSLSTRRGAMKIDAEYVAGNETIRSVDEAVLAIARYLADPQIPEAQARARAAFIEKTYHLIDGRSGERCAQVIHELVSPPLYTDADQEKVRSQAAVVRADFERNDIVRATDRLKALIGIPASRYLRFWKNSGRTSSLPAPEQIQAVELYAQFERLHGRGCPDSSQPSARDGAMPAERS